MPAPFPFSVTSHHRRLSRLSSTLPALFLVVVALLALHASPALALTYDFEDTDVICFVEEVSQADQFITGRYNLFNKPDNKHVAVSLVLYGPDENFVSAQDMSSGENSFSLPVDPQRLGAYRVCAEIVTPGFRRDTKPFVSMEIDVDQTSGKQNSHKTPADGSDDNVVAKREVVDGMTVFTFTDVGGQSKMVLQPPAVLREIDAALHTLGVAIRSVEEGTTHLSLREDRMRMTSESTFVRVWVLAAITIIVTSICVFVQFRMLKRTIVKKKLI